MICDSFPTSKMTETHQEQLVDHLRDFLFFIEFNLSLYLIFSRHRKQQNPAPAQPASPSLQPPAPIRRMKPPESRGPSLDTAERGCYRTLLDELITTDIPSYRNFTRMEPVFFYLIEERITRHLRMSITNFRKDLETDGMSPMQLVHWMENTLLSRSPRSQAVNISTARATSPWYFWL